MLVQGKLLIFNLIASFSAVIGGAFFYLLQQLQADHIVPQISFVDKYVGGLTVSALAFFLIRWLVKRNDKEREYSKEKEHQMIQQIQKTNADLLAEKQKDLDEKEREIDRLRKRLGE